MLRPLRIATPLVAAALSVTLAACGGGNGNAGTGTTGTQTSGNGSGQLTVAQFKQRFEPIDQDIKGVGNGLGQAVVLAQKGKVTDTQLASTFQGLHQRLSSNLDKLAALNPPASIQPDVQRYIAVLRSVDTDLQKVTSALQAHDRSAARSTAIALFADVAKVKPVANALRKKLGLPTSP